MTIEQKIRDLLNFYGPAPKHTDAVIEYVKSLSKFQDVPWDGHVHQYPQRALSAIWQEALRKVFLLHRGVEDAR